MELIKKLTQKQLDETLQKNKYDLKIEDTESSAKKDDIPLFPSSVYKIEVNEIDLLTFTERDLEKLTIP